jgi:hypothetical protein
MTKRSAKAHDIELVPDAWPRFERFIRDIAKAGPQHRPAKAGKPKASRAKNSTARKRKSTAAQ